MAEVLVRFTTTVHGPDGVEYQPQACGGVADDGLWEGWIEFSSGDRVLRTGRETEQPNRDALRYWAEGLTSVYLDGAIGRAIGTKSGLTIASEVQRGSAQKRPTPEPPAIEWRP